MKNLEIIQARVNLEDVETVTHELKRQITRYNQKGAELETTLYFHRRIENDICICIRFEADSEVKSVNDFCVLLTEFLKHYGELNMTSWNQPE